MVVQSPYLKLLSFQLILPELEIFQALFHAFSQLILVSQATGPHFSQYLHKP